MQKLDCSRRKGSQRCKGEVYGADLLPLKKRTKQVFAVLFVLMEETYFGL